MATPLASRASARGVRLRVADRWVVTVPLDRYAVRPLAEDGGLGEPLDGVSPAPTRALRVLDQDGAPVVDAVPAAMAEADTALDPAQVGALDSRLAALLSACAAHAAQVRGRALLAVAHRGLAADAAAQRAVRDVDTDVSVWRSVHAAAGHAAGAPRAAVPPWLALSPRDAAVAWRAGAFGAPPVPPVAPTEAPTEAPPERPVTHDATRVREAAVARQGHGFAKPALSVGLTVAMALALTGCGNDPEQVADDDVDPVCIDRETQEVISEEFCDDDGPRAYPGGFALLVFGGSFFTGPGGRRYVRNYSTTRPSTAGRRSGSGGGVFGGGSRGTGGG